MLIFISEAGRIFLRGVRVLFKGLNAYAGDDEVICHKIIQDCFNKKKKYFMVSNGHFCEFYSRDFGWCTESLLYLGYHDEVLGTLDYALNIFQKHGKITQTITPDGKPFTFPDGKYSPDALAFIVHSLKLAKAKNLVIEYKDFLNKEILKYYDLVVDKKTGLVKKDSHFSSMKDYSIRQSSCYDNVMTGMLAEDLKWAKELVNPFTKYNYTKLLIKHFWNGKYFLDDLSGSKHICGDANVLPFWSGLIKDRRMLKKAIIAVKAEGLDSPLPLKYASGRIIGQKMLRKEILVGAYEQDSVWAHVGLMYIKIAALIDKKLAKRYLEQYRVRILKHKTFLEVYDKNGEPFKTTVYYSDEAMLWCANYLVLKRKLFGS